MGTSCRSASARAAASSLALLLALALLLLAPHVHAAAKGEHRASLARLLAHGQRATGAARATVGAEADAELAAQWALLQAHVTLLRSPSARHKIGALRLRARAEGQAQSILAAAAATTLEAAASLPDKVNRRGAGGKAGRAGGKAGVAAGNGGQSGRKGGNAAGNGGQSGRKGGNAAGNGGQSGRKGGDAAGGGGQSGRKGGDASGIGGQSGRKAGDLPVSPITGSPPPDATNVFTLTGVKRNWPVKVYIRNQGDAATCWAHSALTLLELRQQMSLTSSLMKEWYSVDQIVKCVKNDGAAGGSPLDALEFIINAQLMTDAEVRAGKAIKCDKFDWSKVNHNIGKYTALLALQPCINPGENCSRMRDYEFQMNNEFMLTPMLAYVDASQWDSYAPKFSAAQAEQYALGTAPDYTGVVFSTSKCSMDPAKGDHLVILLGTVTCPKTKKQYWRVYNSWGKEWGVNGYIYLPFEVNACGLANYPVGLSQSGGSDLLSRPIMMLPKTMSQAAGLALMRDKGSGVSGGSELYAYHIKRTQPVAGSGGTVANILL